MLPERVTVETDEPAGGPSRRDDIRALLVVGAVATTAGVVAASLLASSVRLDSQHLALAVAAVGGLLTSYLAVTRFWAFVLLLVAARPTLDLLDQSSGSGDLDPAAAAGLVFIGTAAAWLLVQWLEGTFRRPSGVTLSLLGLAVAGFVSTVSSSDPAASAQASFKILAGVLMFAVLEQVLAREPERVRPLLLAFFASAVVPLLFGLAQLLWAPPDPTDNSLSRVHGTFVHPNSFADFLAVQLIVALAVLPHLGRRWQVALGALTAVSGVVLVFTYARAAWLAALVGILYLGARHRRELLVGVGVLVVAVLLAVPSTLTRVADVTDDTSYGGVPSNSFAWRIHYWGEVSRLAPESPVTGIGLETVRERMDEQLQPHNVHVQTAVELGAVGLAFLVALVVSAVVWLRRRRAEAVDPWSRSLAAAATAVAIAVALLSVSENLLTSTGPYWYLAAALTFGFRPRPARVPQPVERRTAVQAADRVSRPRPRHRVPG
jgi:putative inorganic carbon (hco3(-)) transporter